ncbi:MAG: amidohydrolase family protein [Nannocystaceae bacterium]|nr:amidohydrolase family protein [Nannocystaceae bacterium]
MTVRTLHARNVVLGEADSLRVGPATISIEAGKITEVIEGDPPGSVDDDLGNHLVAPAFINAHTHLSMGGFRGLIGNDALRGNVVEDLFFKLETAISAEDVRAFTRLGALESLRHGVARVWDHYYFAESIAAGMHDVGLRGVIAPTLQDLDGPGVGQREAQLQATEALTAESWGARGIHAALGPHATDTVSASLWSDVVSVARTHGLPVHAHVAQSIEEYARVDERHGLSPLAWLESIGVLADVPAFLAVHAIYVSERDLQRLDPSRHALGYCPLSQQQFCFPAHVPSWQAAGIPWIVGTDCSVSNDSMNVQRELVSVAGIRGFGPSSGEAFDAFRRGPSVEAAHAVDAVRTADLDAHGALAEPHTLLASVWSVPGRLHPAFTAGVIEAGAEADLVIFDPDHPSLWPGRDLLRALAYCDTSSALHGLMVGGQWRIEPGQLGAWLQSDVVRDATTEATARLNALTKKL